MNFQFQHIFFVWLFAAIPVLLAIYIFYQRSKLKVKKRMGDAALIQQLTSNYSQLKSHLKFALLLLAFAAGVIAAINPGKPGSATDVNRKGVDIAIALDVSNSMLATDTGPNRLEKAKLFIGELLSSFADNRVALIIFAGKAYMQMPLTTDYGAVNLFVASASPTLIAHQGTSLKEALQMSANAFIISESKFKSVILITDGEGHDEGAVDFAKDMAAKGLMIHAVGIGSTQGSKIPESVKGEFKKDEDGNTVTSVLKEKILQELAAATNGNYIRLQSVDEAVRKITTHLAQTDKKTFANASPHGHKSYYWFFASIMLLILLTELFISERKAVTTGKLKLST